MIPIPERGTILAPMRSLTQAPLWAILQEYGAPDLVVSEFVRIHENFFIDEKWLEECLRAAGNILLCIQLMGHDIDALAKNIEILQKYPLAGIDFNVGCPMPKIYKKSVGGGLLRDLPTLKVLLKQLRACCSLPLSVKTRLGFADTHHFEELLDVLNEANLDWITIHARTVKELYQGTPHYEYLKVAAQKIRCPVIANGNIDNLDTIKNLLKDSQCFGVMIGRAALSNPWIFQQWRAYTNNLPMPIVTYADLFAYLKKIEERFCLPQTHPITALGCLKRFSKYLAESVNQQWLHESNRTTTIKDFWMVAEKYLLKGEASQKRYL